MNQKEVTHGASEIEPEEIEDYWTPERVKNAIPKPHDKPEPSGQPETTETTEAAPAKVANPATPPYLACGKLLFTWNGQNYVGSASAIDEHVLVTAAHNIYDFDDRGKGSYSTNVLFYAAYSGPPPSYSFPYDVALAPGGWVNQAKGSRPHQYDYAMVRIPKSMKALTPLTMQVNIRPTSQSQWEAIGYPGSPADGKTMYEVRGTYFKEKEPGTVGMTNNDMAKGCSGGPWLVVDNGLQFLVNGVNSYGADQMYSPYFDGAVADLLVAVKKLPASF